MSTEKAKLIKLLVLDVDGVLTDGGVSYANSDMEVKSFNIKDGLGIKLLQSAGIGVGIITGRNSPMVDRRATELGIHPLIQGREDKGVALQAVARQTRLDMSQVAYMGDDLPDLSAMTSAGLAMAPADAHEEILEVSDWIAARRGGKGAVREACDFILHAQGTYAEVTSKFRAQK